ncbi:MAG: cob(I)yrinic acid a,c-diamide adenosyltransferase [Candidatus Hydrogenedentota bacterium]
MRGLIQVYTGDGKGKTTAAIGLAVRARSQGLKVCYIYFHKDPDKWGYGEHKILKKLKVDIYGFAKEHTYFLEDKSSDKILKDCLHSLEFIKKIYQKNKYDMLILDEILISLRDGFIKEKEILELIKIKPTKLELILTGRGVTEKIIRKADYVSEIKKVKHPFDLGVKSRKGIEF